MRGRHVGIFEDIFVAEAGKPELEGSKGGGKPQAGTALQPRVGTEKSSSNVAPRWMELVSPEEKHRALHGS